MVEYSPSSLKEALALAASEKVTPVAGGTDLMVRFKSSANKEARISSPLMVGDLEELKGITRRDGFLCIRACTSLADIINADEVPAVFKKALSQIGSPAIRNQGTLGGNICNASPAGDSLPLLYLFKAELVLISQEGERIVSLENFITGPGRTVRQKNELLKEIRLREDLLSGKYFYVFEKMGNRKADAISKASFALRISLEEGILCDIEAAFGAMGPRVTLLNKELKDFLLNESYPLVNLDKSTLKEKLFALLTPIDDQRSTAEYRKTVALNLLHYYLTTDIKSGASE
jgi:CO/xanthine dehydrogenase FAD-binding subunit